MKILVSGNCPNCQGDEYVSIHANLPDVKCKYCKGTGKIKGKSQTK